MGAIDDLAARCGIVSEFVDARGVRRPTRRETAVALLAAMGVDAPNDAAAREVLADWDEAARRQVLAPVTVRRQNGVIEIDLTAMVSVARVHWRVDLEDGSVRRGAQSFDGGAGCRLRLSETLPVGHHRLTLEPGEHSGALIIAPARAWLPHALETGDRLWGVAVQLYLLRSRSNWGIGDYADLRSLASMLSRRGADVLGVNPLHALFTDSPEHASPYAPASRLLLNTLNIDVAGVPEMDACAPARAWIDSAAFRATLSRLRDTAEVDYTAVCAAKMRALRMLFDAFRVGDPPRHRALAIFRGKRGAAWERHCLFLALREHFASQSAAFADWHAWPEAYRDPNSPAVGDFARDHAEAVTFQAWMQFEADRQLAGAADAAREMAVGIYRDLAVGADPSGAETWAGQSSVAADVHVGVPPDIHNPAGQDWGLTPFHPAALRAEAYRGFVELLRANMRHAGGLRIDHVMSLRQLYWVPRGGTPADGAFVRYPLEDLLAIVALESQRNRCLVVGEDLGTVPEGLREALGEHNILSYRVLLFERDEHSFLPPDRYPRLAIAVAGNHDLPTQRAWWAAGDIDLKESLGLFPTAPDAQRARAERSRDRRDLLEALRRARLVGAGDAPVEELVAAVHAFLARSGAALALAQIDDIVGETTPVNVPATADEHPNWRRRQASTLEELDVDPRLSAVAALFGRRRQGNRR